MHQVLLLGAGKIGHKMAQMLANSGDFEVSLADADEGALEHIQPHPHLHCQRVDARDAQDLARAMQGKHSVVSALSYRFNPVVAQVALETGLSYFDLTEDVATTAQVKALASQARDDQIFMPQSGLAPGFISIVAQHLTQDYEELKAVRLRVGALPQFPNNAMRYNLTWSTDGLINEYCNLCEAIHEGEKIDILPLEGLEHFALDGIDYEAFNTSGGLGTLCETLAGRVRELNYKTVRYPGHRDLMAFVIRDLGMSERRDELLDIMESAVPVTYQDVVLVFCSVSGWKQGELIQSSDARKIYPRQIDGENWSAIQLCTSAGLCAVLDMHRQNRLPRRGFVRQEQVALPDFLDNRFGAYFADGGPPQTAKEFSR